jgi:hypothetical protein
MRAIIGEAIRSFKFPFQVCMAPPGIYRRVKPSPGKRTGTAANKKGRGCHEKDDIVCCCSSDADRLRGV